MLDREREREGQKAAFLAPFEVFYDALRDSGKLKGWLERQVGRATGLIRVLDRERWEVGGEVGEVGEEYQFKLWCWCGCEYNRRKGKRWRRRDG